MPTVILSKESKKKKEKETKTSNSRRAKSINLGLYGDRNVESEAGKSRGR